MSARVVKGKGSCRQCPKCKTIYSYAKGGHCSVCLLERSEAVALVVVPHTTLRVSK